MNFFSQSGLNNNKKPEEKTNNSITPQQKKCSLCLTTSHICKVCSKKVCNFCSFGSKEHDKIRVHKTCLPQTDADLYLIDQEEASGPSLSPENDGEALMEDLDEIEDALGDAVTLCQLSNSRLLHDRFRNWVIFFQSLIGPSNERLERKRSQSLQRYNFPG